MHWHIGLELADCGFGFIIIFDAVGFSGREGCPENF